jgi:tetratricopeptide (TPR) repeat protein
MNANRMAAALGSFLRGLPLPTQTTGKICPRCGWQNRAKARFCARDGTPLAQPPSASVSQAVSPPAAGAKARPTLSPEMLFESANAYARTRNYTQAIPRYEACLQKGFNDLAVFYNLGLCYLEVGRFSEAAGVLEKGIAHYPKDGDLYYQLARAYTGLKSKEKALGAAERACQLAPDDAINLRQYGRLLLEAKRYQESARQLERSIQRDPDSVLGQILLGRAYGEMNNLQKAVDSLRRAAQLDSKVPEPHYWMAVFYQRAKNKREAKESLQQALKISPNYQLAKDLKKKL